MELVTVRARRALAGYRADHQDAMLYAPALVPQS